MNLTSPFLDLPERELAAFCARWDVRELALTGSALHGPFAANSDIDFVFHAAREAAIYTEFGAPKHEAIQELTSIVGRRADLVCPRQVLASANPYAIHNLLGDPAAPRADRFAGLAWYLASAAGLLGALAKDDRDPFAQHLQRVALVRLARTCDSSERIAAWSAMGLEAVPFARVRDAVGPVLQAMRAHARPTWPADAALDDLAHALAPHVASIAEVTARIVHATPPPPAPAEAVVQLAFRKGDRAPALVSLLPFAAPVYRTSATLDIDERAALLTRTRRDGERLVMQPLVARGERYVLHTVLLPRRKD